MDCRVFLEVSPLVKCKIGGSYRSKQIGIVGRRSRREETGGVTSVPSAWRDAADNPQHNKRNNGLEVLYTDSRGSSIKLQSLSALKVF
jgi:hypothetical protein